jgi:hypothetical protein
MYLHHGASTLAITVAVFMCTTGAEANVRVGGAIVVVRDVSGLIPGETPIKIVQGQDVFENQFINTATQSKAQIDFLDRTQIEIGPATTLKIDRVAFNPNRSLRALAVTAQNGALMWVSGNSVSNAYRISTSHALIKVKGTAFNLLVDRERTQVVLQSGRVDVCSAAAPSRCKTLSRRGETILATSSGLANPQMGPDPSDFGALCLSPNSNCAITATFIPPPPPPPNNSGGGKRRADNPSSKEHTTYVPPPGRPRIPPRIIVDQRPPPIIVRYPAAPPCLRRSGYRAADASHPSSECKSFAPRPLYWTYGFRRMPPVYSQAGAFYRRGYPGGRPVPRPMRGGYPG